VTTLAADFGGTTIKLGLVRDGRVLMRHRLPAEADQPMVDRLEAVVVAWRSMADGLGIHVDECIGAGLSLPFLMDPDGARVHGEFFKFTGAAAIDFSAWGRERLGLPVAIENDLRMALLGEWTAGAARDADDAVMISFGSGIGCAALLGGRLVQGSRHWAGTLLAHTTVAVDGDPGRCGNVGCAEDLACTATLDAVARALPGFAESRLRDAGPLDYEIVFRLADEGDAASRALVARSLRVWSALALTAVVAFDPRILVLGGGVISRHDVVIPAVRDHIARFRPGVPWEVSVVRSQLGDDAALVGCERLLRDQTPGPA